MNKRTLGLGLESSCDETSASVVENGSKILSNIINSQIEIHKAFSGVVPEIASRAHLESINTLIDKALEQAGTGFCDLDYVAATSRPGLVGSLLIGLQSAKVISYSLNIPLIAVNHLEAHLYAPFLEGAECRYPFIGLLVSGGNTSLYIVNGIGDMRLIGKTGDDAIGEAYDKISKFLDLGYPGGPIIDRLAKQSENRPSLLPKILPGTDDYRFSYSGLKTAVINYIRENPDADRIDLVYSFQERALELIVRKTFAAAREYQIKDIVIAGGVAANSRLREMLKDEKKSDENIIIASPVLCTDNAAMVAGIGYRYFAAKIFSDLSVDVEPRIS